jgi:hypothetical protein
MMACLSLVMVVTCLRWFKLKSPLLSSRAGADHFGTPGFYPFFKEVHRSCKKDKAWSAFRKHPGTTMKWLPGMNSARSHLSAR